MVKVKQNNKDFHNDVSIYFQVSVFEITRMKYTIYSSVMILQGPVVQS